MACWPMVGNRMGAGKADAWVGAFVREALLWLVLLACRWVLFGHLLAEPGLWDLGRYEVTGRIGV